MAKYIYQVEAVGNIKRINTYSYTTLRSLRACLELVAEKAASNSDHIDLKHIKKEFRTPSMLKVGFNCTKKLANGREIESRYMIFRYHNVNGIPVQGATQ